MLERFFLGALILTSVSLPATAQTLMTGEPVIVDSNDLLVAPVLEYTQASHYDTFSTALFVDNRAVFLELSPNGLGLINGPLDGYRIEVAYESSDCSGQPYLTGTVADPTASYLSQTAAATNILGALSLWVPASSTAVTGLTFLSAIEGLSGLCLSPILAATSGFPAVELPTPYVGPYRVIRAPGTTSAPQSVPAVSAVGLAALALLLIAAGWQWLRR